jgi:hypothetical protein
MLEFIKSWKFMAILVALLTLTVAVMLVYGIVTHTEAGFMEERPLWEPGDFPLTVCASSYVETEHRTDAVAYAVATTNSRLGFDAYVLMPVGTTACSVSIVLGAPLDVGATDPGGDAVFDSRVPAHCAISTVNTGTAELTQLTLQHELGHCLGLAHDDFRSSIMFGGEGNSLAPTPSGQFPPRITDSDRALLREAYAQ